MNEKREMKVLPGLEDITGFAELFDYDGTLYCFGPEFQPRVLRDGKFVQLEFSPTIGRPESFQIIQLSKPEKK